MTPVDLIVLLLRLWVGTVMLRHGRNHAKSIEGTAGWFRSVGFRQAELNAKLSAAGEVAMAGALYAGFLVPFAAAGVIATMLVAFWSIHRFAGFFVFARPDEGYEYVVTLALAAATMAVLGAGPVSVDGALGIADDLDGWVGATIAAAGLVAGAAQLALFWRKPPGKGEATDTNAA